MDLEPNEVKFDRNELKALASDTRVEILKTLKERNHTVSELSQKLGHSKSTLHEHLTRLMKADLVEKADNYTNKWVYYRLSRRGKELFADSTKRVVVIISSILLIVGVMQLAVFFTSVPLLSPTPKPIYVATGAEAEETVSPEAISKAYPFEQPMPEEEQRVVTQREIEEQRAGGEFEPQPGAKEEIPYFFIGGISFISAAFILAHYYHTRPNKIFLEKKEKK